MLPSEGRCLIKNATRDADAGMMFPALGGIMTLKMTHAMRMELAGAIRGRYAAAPDGDKRRILEEFVAATGYHEKSAIRVLNTPLKPKRRQTRQRASLYDEAARGALIVLWEASDRVCGKRLKALLPILLPALERYVFRIALTNARIVGLDDETVTIQYKDRKTGRARTCRFSGDEFMRRFLQHVLPRGFHKVRYFGLWHPTQRDTTTRVRQMLQLQAPPPSRAQSPKLDPAQDPIAAPLQPLDAEPVRPIEPMIRPHCHQGRLIFIRRLTRPQAMGP